MGDEVTDDSVLRAIAAAPSLPPPARPAPAPDQRPPRGLYLAMALAVAVTITLVVLVRAGVAVGTPVPAWKLGDVPVTMPNNLFDQLGLREVSYVLETDIALSDEQRGRALVLALDCFHAPLAATIDGTPLADTGDVAVGEHRYRIEPARSARGTVHVALAAHKDIESAAGFGTVPRIALASEMRGTVAAFNRYTTLVALVLAALIAFLYGGLYLLDRRPEYVALVIGMAATIVMCLCLLDVLPRSPATLVGRCSSVIMTSMGATMFLTIVYFIHLAFELGRVPLVWRAPWIAVIATAVVSPLWFPLLVACGFVFAFMGPATVVYVMVRCARMTGSRAREARLLLVWAVPQLASTCIEQFWRFRGTHVLGGMHLVGFSIIMLVLGQSAVLVLQFVARQRTIETTADELRRQVAERSKELADALARLADRPQASLVGKTLDDRYRVLAPLGAGGMGAVYEVERTSDRQRFALKTLRDRVDAKLMARFAREAQFAAELRHPNLVPVLDVGIADGALYLVMELVADGALERERKRFGDPAWAVPILGQIASGLAAIHEKGIVHRDLKPANILFDRGVARIADFGLAGLHTAGPVSPLDATTPASPQLTRLGDVFGTPAYMAPELAAGASSAGPSADVFAFGVIAHELCAGRSPFAEPPVLARMHGRAAVATIAELAPPLRALVERCLDLDPAKRPTSAELVTVLAGARG